MKRPDTRCVPFLAVPRGPGEVLWHAAVAGALLLFLANPGMTAGVLPAAVLTGWLVHWQTRILLGAAGLITLVSLAVVYALGGTATDLARAWWHASELVPSLTLNAWHLLILYAWTQLPVALVIVAIVSAYDVRSVRRGVVDERLWERQQRRRANVRRAEHHRIGEEHL